jgi:membrane protein YqaA with SNARE-associated domain
LVVYGGLFLAAFLAATILPMQSEAVLAGLLLSGVHSWPMLIAVAAFGNVLGSVVNWLLGRFIERFSGRSWFPVSEDRLEQASSWYRRYGKWSLLGSWLPVVGDPITVAAGVLREPFLPFLALVTIAKTGRYLFLALAVSGFF